MAITVFIAGVSSTELELPRSSGVYERTDLQSNYVRACAICIQRTRGLAISRDSGMKLKWNVSLRARHAASYHSRMDERDARGGQVDGTSSLPSREGASPFCLYGE